MDCRSQLTEPDALDPISRSGQDSVLVSDENFSVPANPEAVVAEIPDPAPHASSPMTNRTISIGESE